MTPIIIDDAAAPLLGVAGKVLTGDDLPDVALIGGLAVTVRVAAPGIAYRATFDIDIVTEDETPGLVELLVDRHRVADPVVIDDIKVDVIPTTAVSNDDLDGIDDGPRLFVAGHRWALDTAEVVEVATVTGPTSVPLAIRVARPAGLVAAKCHAVGYARSRRLASKHGSDLFDAFRLLTVHRPGPIATELHSAPGRLAPVVAEVVRTGFLANPDKAARSMAMPGTEYVDTRRVVAVMDAFVNDLDG